MQFGEKFKRFISIILCFTLLLSTTPTVFAASSQNEEALKTELAADTSLYPNGAFSFYESQLTANEGDGTILLEVVRRGSTAGEASVDFKAIDITSTYGKDYTLSVKENMFFTRVLEANPDAMTLSEFYVDGEHQETVEQKVYSQDDNQVLQFEKNSVSTEVYGEAANDKQVLQFEGKSELEDKSEFEDKSVSTEVYGDVTNELTYSETDLSTNNTSSVIGGLRGIRAGATGKMSDRASWRELTDTTDPALGNQELEEVVKESEDVSEYVNQIAQEIPGVDYTLKFTDGEYKKTIKINLNDDNISETDEQVMFILSNAVDAELGGSYTAYVNITDNDENEPVMFSMSEKNIFALRSDGYADITIERTSGIEKFASVIVGTGAVDAKPGVDYQATKIEVIFPQGVKSKTIRVPLLDNPNSDGSPVTFVVAIDTEEAYAVENQSKTYVTIMDKAEDNRLDSYIAGFSDMSNNGILKSASVSAFSNYYTENLGSKSIKDGIAHVRSGVDLSTAESITIKWKASGQKVETVDDGCDETKEYHYGKKVYLRINNNDILIASTTDKYEISGTKTYSLPDKFKLSNAKIEIRGISTNGNTNCTFDAESIKVNYPPITFQINNTSGQGYTNNTYIEKIYTIDGDKVEKGKRYKDGNLIVMGQAQIKKHGGTWNDRATVYKASDGPLFTTTTTGYSTSNGVSVSQGKNGNIYLAGYQLQKADSYPTQWSDIILPDDMVFNKTFLDKYKKDYFFTASNTFVVRPVFYPYAAVIKFNNSDSSKGRYSGFSNNEIFTCTMLDTLEITGIANSGYSVSSFSIKGFKGTTIHGDFSQNKTAEMGNYYRTASEAKRREIADKYENSSANKAIKAKTSSTISNVVTFTPTGDFNYINMFYSRPKISLKIDPKNSPEYQNKGKIVYTDLDNPEKNSKVGDYQHPIEVLPISIGNSYTFTAVPDDSKNQRYKAYWKDWTGDENGDGILSTQESAEVAKYGLVRTASNGNTFTYIPKLTNSLIYYGFLPLAKNTDGNLIEGVVCIKDSPVFGKEDTTITPVNGAAVYVDEYSTKTEYNSGHGGLHGRGGDGYFYIASDYFTAAENHNVSIMYGNLTMTASQPVNAAQRYILDAYDTIDVTNAQIFKKDSNGEYKSITKDEVANDDASYQIVLTTNSDKDSIIATKAKFSYYRQDGSHIKDETINSDNYNSGTNYGNGIFTYEFNPATLQIPAGSYMTVTFFDQNETAYYEHKLGFTFTQALGLISLVSSFDTPLKPAVSLIGTINSEFDFGWDGNLDDTESGYITTKDGIKTLSYGYTFNYGSEESQRKILKKKAILGSSEKEKKEKEKAAKEAVDSSDKEGDDSSDDKKKSNKKSAKLSARAYVNFDFAIGLRLAKSEMEGHVGEWYFVDMVLTITADGGATVSMSYVTPIGIPVIIILKTGVSGQGIVVVDQTYDKKEYYVTDVMDEETGKIDLLNFNMQDSNRAFDAYGDFQISPYIDLSAGTGFEFLNLVVGGRADFEFNFTTLADNNSGSVDLEAYLKLKLLFFEKEWPFADKSVSLFGARSLGSNTYLYESLDELKPSSRDYLKNRTKQKRMANLFSIAPTSNFNEEVLLNGVYQYPDIKMADLGDGKLLAVFVDDVPSRSDNNSTAVYYRIYDGVSWSDAQIIEDDGTADDSPIIYDIPGKDQLYIAWSTSSKEFGTDEEFTALDVLTSRNIHGCFFDKSSMEFGPIQQVTKNTEGVCGYEYGDYYGDAKPQLAYYKDEDGKENMIIYYTKSEYQLTGMDNGVLGDALNPYSVIAYRFYDFENDEWISSYTEEDKETVIANYQAIANSGSPDADKYADWLNNSEGMWEIYEEGMYGQRFLELAPLVLVNEKLDDEGYWTEQAEFVEYIGNIDPLVTESTVISYNDLALYAYVLDYDGSRETNYDRDVFMQIYNFKENTFTHPIMVTSNDVPDEGIKFVRIRDYTMLSWLCDGEIMMFDISSNVSNGNTLKTGSLNGQEYYYFEKTRDSEYVTPIVVAESATDESMPDLKNQFITSFDMVASDNYVYALWTQRDIKLANGIEEGSQEAADPQNRKVETQIYLSRYSVDEDFMTKPIQITDESGANYDDIAFVVFDSGKFKALAVKGGSTTKVGENGIEFPVEDVENRKLVSIDFTPYSVLTLEEAEVSEIGANSLSPAYVKLYNEGVETLKDLTVTITSKDGTELYNTVGASVYGGDTLTCNFEIQFDEDDTGCEFEIVANNGEEILRETYIQEEEVKLDVISLYTELIERGEVNFTAELKNKGTISSGVQTFELKYIKDDETKILYSKELEALRPGESIIIQDTIDINYDEVFSTIEDESGYVQGDVEIIATTNTGATATSALTLLATSEQMNTVNAIDKIKINNVSLEVGDVRKLEAKIIAKEGYDVEEISNKLKVNWIVDDEDIVTLYDSGYIEGLKEGKTTATAYIMPANNVITEVGQVDNYPTLPDAAIKVSTATIIVDDDDSKSHKRSSKVEEPEEEIVKELEEEIVTDTSDIPFTDVGEKDWFYESVKYAYESNLFNGVSDTTFEPNTPMSRAMFVTVLYRFAGIPATEGIDSGFIDVEDDMWYSEAVKWAKANEIVLGVNDKEFMPDETITREQMCTMLGRYINNTGIQLPESEEPIQFDDNDEISSYAKEMVDLMQVAGIIKGKDENKFVPKDNATRAEVATIIQRFIQGIKE